MPLDALYAVETRTLADTVDRIGITPISRQVLDHHKKAQVAKNPGHWFAPYAHRYQDILAGLTISATVIAMANMVSSGILGIIGHHWHIMIGCGVLSVMFFYAVYRLDALFMESHKIKGPAKWREFSPSTLTLVPTPIVDLAAMIRNELPTATFIMGLLVQDNIVLDPYLIIRDGAEEAILGIWDESGIIEIATVT